MEQNSPLPTPGLSKVSNSRVGGGPGIEKIINLKFSLFLLMGDILTDFQGEFPSIFQRVVVRPLNVPGGHPLSFPGVGTSP